jgi:hypothetical protein
LARGIVPQVYQRAEYASLAQAFLSSFDRLHGMGLLDEWRILQTTCVANLPIVCPWDGIGRRLPGEGNAEPKIPDRGCLPAS